MDTQSFHHIVVGAGSAGCAVAARLSEDPDVRVLLLEAGPEDAGPQFSTPALNGRLYKSDWDWDFSTDPEPALGGRRAYLPRGRVLGGTSSINSMVYTRGNPGDYDGWAALGVTGWSYRDVLPYFRRAEDNSRGASEFHGVGGPLRVTEGRHRSRLVEAWLEAAQEAGLPWNEDFNGASQFGVGRYQVTQREGRRFSASSAYLGPARARGNLSVRIGALVLRVLVEGGRAVGVEVLLDGEVSTLRAEGEVVLSAGTYLTPQLLMLSGIGPGEHLSELGVPVVVDNAAVGANLRDHVGCFVSYRASIESLFEADTVANRELLETEGRGPLASNGPEAGAFAHAPGHTGDVPQLQFHAVPAMFRDEGLSPAYDNGFSLSTYVNQPRSTGRVLLRSPLARSKPRIQHDYLTAPEDWELLREGVAFARDTVLREPLLSLLRNPELSVRDGLAPASDRAADLDAFITRTAFSFFHPVGTAALGAVVDDDLRVRGVDNLRVADASVLPTLIAGNTNAPAIMVGERAADFVRGGAQPHAADLAGP